MGRALSSAGAPPPTEPDTQRLVTARLVLEPLRPDHADELAALLDDPALHAFTGGRPATLEELRTRYARQAVGRSPDGRQRWRNWVARRRDDDRPVGTLQATVGACDGLRRAELAWVIVPAQQDQGFAREAARAVADLLLAQGVDELVAHVAPGHRASVAVAEAIGLRATDVFVDGERRWRLTA